MADPSEALAVLQTLLAGSPDVRLSLDAKTNKIIALARPSEHRTIQATLDQLEGQSPHVEVIQLRKIDPQLAVLTIGKFFSEDGKDSTSTIKIDADPTTMKLYVKATDAEIAQIKQLIEQLEGPAESSSGDRGNLRFIPLTGGSAESTVEAAASTVAGSQPDPALGTSRFRPVDIRSAGSVTQTTGHSTTSGDSAGPAVGKDRAAPFATRGNR